MSPGEKMTMKVSTTCFKRQSDELGKALEQLNNVSSVEVSARVQKGHDIPRLSPYMFKVEIYFGVPEDVHGE